MHELMFQAGVDLKLMNDNNYCIIVQLLHS